MKIVIFKRKYPMNSEINQEGGETSRHTKICKVHILHQASISYKSMASLQHLSVFSSSHPWLLIVEGPQTNSIKIGFQWILLTFSYAVAFPCWTKGFMRIALKCDSLFFISCQMTYIQVEHLSAMQRRTRVFLFLFLLLSFHFC